ncbi:DUF937 domain-containing protein [Empedobacter falsenii]|uniref:DUF937 domain-containing protein n=1 Tax=Empedobacter falsenii TaxID=343874 RepID=A0A7H9DQ86_9FLAO|nr:MULTISPECIES: DUF937 domain-containing protein [Empedobacter]MBW1619213.1 DUF937 domain-containing protein [Empedobacter falsenii]MDH0660379.1 DUF937 domain-containing protein [Empedobacter sp. GD03865]MDH1603261.1 DUF937 domain-containing protein [Empedobacter sp. GD03739]MDH2208245.1 DUF937 domain-containing protein [Empedobacter sp. GD03644]MDM1063697.1 DUF937 domain-containing protein [Empedobacter falsenii]
MDFTNLIQGAMGQQIVGSAAKQLGINESQAQTAVAAAVPFLLSALNKNAQGGGAEGISNALNQHDGSILDNLSGFLGQGGNQQDGLGILGHVLGNKQQNVESAISQQSGLNTAQVTQILALVAPIVMGYLGKQKQSAGLDSNGIAGLLGGLVGGSTTQTNQSGVNLGGFEKLLDQDGDGQLGIGDAMSLLGGFFKK